MTVIYISLPPVIREGVINSLFYMSEKEGQTAAKRWQKTYVYFYNSKKRNRWLPSPKYTHCIIVCPQKSRGGGEVSGHVCKKYVFTPSHKNYKFHKKIFSLFSQSIILLALHFRFLFSQGIPTWRTFPCWTIIWCSHRGNIRECHWTSTELQKNQRK